MCFASTPKAPPVPVPTKVQTQREPDEGVDVVSRRRIEDQQRGRASTILTSGSGVATDSGALGGKTLLGV